RVGGTDIGAQAAVALENLGQALAAAGAGPADVTMLRVYIVGFNRDVAAQIASRVAQFFAGVDPPASTWVGVQALMHPDFLIEIEADAAAPIDRPVSASEVVLAHRVASRPGAGDRRKPAQGRTHRGHRPHPRGRPQAGAPRRPYTSLRRFAGFEKRAARRS